MQELFPTFVLIQVMLWKQMYHPKFRWDIEGWSHPQHGQERNVGAKMRLSFPAGCVCIRRVSCLGLDCWKTVRQNGFSLENERKHLNEKTLNWYEAKRGLKAEKAL